MEDINELKEQEKEKEPKERKGRNNAWLGGVVLILVGVYFLLNNLTDFNFANWWAIFILIPAFASFGNAYRLYNEAGKFTSQARGSLMGGLFMTFVACVFLFQLDWGKIWPVFIILAGLGALLNAVLGR